MVDPNRSTTDTHVTQTETKTSKLQKIKNFLNIFSNLKSNGTAFASAESLTLYGVDMVQNYCDQIPIT